MFTLYSVTEFNYDAPPVTVAPSPVAHRTRSKVIAAVVAALPAAAAKKNKAAVFPVSTAPSSPAKKAPAATALRVGGHPVWVRCPMRCDQGPTVSFLPPRSK